MASSLYLAIWLTITGIVLFFLSKFIRARQLKLGSNLVSRVRPVYLLSWPSYLFLFLWFVGLISKYLLLSNMGFNNPDLAYALIYYYRLLNFLHYLFLAFITYQLYQSLNKGYKSLYKYRLLQFILLLLPPTITFGVRLLDFVWMPYQPAFYLVIYLLVAILAFLSSRKIRRGRIS